MSGPTARTRANKGPAKRALRGAGLESSAARAYNDWHWKLDATHLIDWPDPDYPDELIECGRLVELRVREPSQRRTTHITLAGAEIDKSHLAFDHQHPYQRLYILASDAVRRDAKIRFWDRSTGPTWDLNDLAEAVGGHHGTPDYPPVKVKPVGILLSFVYATRKKDDFEEDGKGSYYVHKCGEESGLQPVLAVDARGRLWVAGSNYTSPPAGVTD
jgi:hypothetical protein